MTSQTPAITNIVMPIPPVSEYTIGFEFTSDTDVIVKLDGTVLRLNYDYSLQRDTNDTITTGKIILANPPVYQSWSSLVTYAENDIVMYNAKLYILIAGSSKGSQPDISPNVWEEKNAPELTIYRSITQSKLANINARMTYATNNILLNNLVFSINDQYFLNQHFIRIDPVKNIDTYNFSITPIPAGMLQFDDTGKNLVVRSEVEFIERIFAAGYFDARNVRLGIDVELPSLSGFGTSSVLIGLDTLPENFVTFSEIVSVYSSDTRNVYNRVGLSEFPSLPINTNTLETFNYVGNYFKDSNNIFIKDIIDVDNVYITLTDTIPQSFRIVADAMLENKIIAANSNSISLGEEIAPVILPQGMPLNTALENLLSAIGSGGTVYTNQVFVDTQIGTTPVGDSLTIALQDIWDELADPPILEEWSPTYEYSLGDVISYNLKIYTLIVATNTGTQPDTDPNVWQRTNPPKLSQYESGFTYNTGESTTIINAGTSKHEMYVSIVDGNLGNYPPTNPDKWVLLNAITPKWLSNYTYSQYDTVVKGNLGSNILFYSTQDNNVGHPPLYDSAYWRPIVEPALAIWIPDFPYGNNSAAIHTNIIWQSTQAANKNNEPSYNSIYWKPLIEPTLEKYNPNYSYSTDNLITFKDTVYGDFRIYASETDTNKNNTPSYDSVYWNPVIKPFVPEFAPDYTYSKGNSVMYTNTITGTTGLYISKTDGNKGNPPDLSPTDWVSILDQINQPDYIVSTTIPTPAYNCIRYVEYASGWIEMIYDLTTTPVAPNNCVQVTLCQAVKNIHVNIMNMATGILVVSSVRQNWTQNERVTQFEFFYRNVESIASTPVVRTRIIVTGQKA